MSFVIPPMGWIPPDDRSPATRAAYEASVKKMPKFAPPRASVTPPVGTKILLTDFWKHPKVVADLGGKPFTGTHQLTGSCVGAGGGNVLFTLSAVQRVLGYADKAIVPFWLLPYGRSRLDANMRGQGEGSLGATFAQACREDGVIDAADSGVSYTTDDGYIWGQSVEMTWSDGTNAPDSMLAASRKHLVGTTSELKSGADVRDAIVQSLSPVARAFGSFVNPGSASVKQGALVAKGYDGAGGHQESWQGYWNHPDLGELIWEQNQWGLKVYGSDPGGGADGGVWLPIDVVDRAVKSGDAEIYAYSAFQGFPSQSFSWLT